MDAGCGVGWFGEHKPDRSIRVWGIDVNKAAVEIAKKYETATVGDVKELPYPDRFFDGVLAFHIVEHVHENLRVMKEFYRVLKKKGVLAAESPSPWCDAWEDYTHVRPYTLRSFSNLAKDAGFRIVECYYLGGGIPGFGKLKLHSLSHSLGRFLANRFHLRRGHVFMVGKK